MPHWARQSIQIMLAIAAVVVAAMCIATTRYSCTWTFSNGEVALDHWLLNWIVYPRDQSILMTPGLSVRSHPLEVQWAWGFQASPSSFIGTVPIVLILAVTSLALTLVIRSNKKFRLIRLAGRCTRCEFDLAGLPRKSKCPECGRSSV